MSTDTPPVPAGETTRERLVVYLDLASKWLGFVLACVAFGIWILGDRQQPPPPTPVIPSFLTVDLMPTNEPPVYTGVAGVVRMVGDGVDPNLMAGDLDHYYPRLGHDDLIVTVRDEHRLSRPRLVQFGEHSAIRLDGKPVDKVTLLAHLSEHRVRVQFHGGGTGPVREAEFTTVGERPR